MKKQIFGALGVVLMVFAVEGWIFGGQAVAREVKNDQTAQNLFADHLRTQPVNHLPAEAAARTPSGPMLLLRPDDDADQEDMAAMFQADVKGNLVLNEKTRLNIEKLSMLNTPEELKAKIKDFSDILPSAAHRQLVRLMDAFQKYASAAIRQYPSDKEPKTLKEVMIQYEGIHDLRVKYFGTDAAEAFFGEEEKFSRRLLDIMGTLDESIPLPDRAHMAQEILKKDMESRARPRL